MGTPKFKPVKPCIFCPNPRTRKKGEHSFDDWLNREAGRPVTLKYNTTIFGRDDALVREYSSRKLQEAKDVVCDECNHNWMSDLTDHARATIEGFIRYERPFTLLPLGTITLTAFACLKSMILDYAAEQERKPLISRLSCTRFRESLAPGGYGPAVPDGAQIWIAWYHREREMEAQAWTRGLRFDTGRFAGYNVLVITYMVGAFVFQFTCPKWTKLTRRRPPLPFITQAAVWDSLSMLILSLLIFRTSFEQPREMRSASGASTTRVCRALKASHRHDGRQ